MEYDDYGTPIETSIYRGYERTRHPSSKEGSDFLGYAQIGGSLISSIANLWSTHQNNKIARETLAFNKDQYAKQYESFLSDRARRINRQNILQDSVNRANNIKDDSHWRVGANPAGEGHDTIGQDGTNYSQMSEEERNQRRDKKKKRIRKLTGSSPAAPSGTVKANRKIDMNNQVKPKVTNRQLAQNRRKL